MISESVGKRRNSHAVRIIKALRKSERPVKLNFYFVGSLRMISCWCASYFRNNHFAWKGFAFEFSRRDMISLDFRYTSSGKKEKNKNGEKMKRSKAKEIVNWRFRQDCFTKKKSVNTSRKGEKEETSSRRWIVLAPHTNTQATSFFREMWRFALCPENYWFLHQVQLIMTWRCRKSHFQIPFNTFSFDFAAKFRLKVAKKPLTKMPANALWILRNWHF